MKSFLEKLSRRAFLKTSAAAGALAALGCSKNDSGDDVVYIDRDDLTDYTPDKAYSGMCRANCWENCRLYAHVRNGRVVRTSMAPMPDSRYNRICAKGLSHVQRMYHPDRITKPLRRVAGTERGAGQWEEISWEIAVNDIAEKFKEIINDGTLNADPKDGGRSIAVFSGSGNYASVNGIFGFTNAFKSYLGASGISSTLDNSLPAGMCYVMGADAYNFLQGNEPAQMLNAKTIITWGSNITESQVQTWHFIPDAVEQNGATHIAIDIRYNITASKAHHFVHVKPASDTVLTLHMIKRIMDKFSAGDERYVDRRYVIQNTTAPFLVYTTGSDAGKFVRDGTGNFAALEDDGSATGAVVYTSPEAFAVAVGTENKAGLDINKTYWLEGAPAATVNSETVVPAYQLLRDHIDAQCAMYNLQTYTGVSDSVMEEVTDLYALNKPSTIYLGYGTDHYTNGHQHGRALAVIAALTGNIGKEGAGLGYFIPMTPFMNYSGWYKWITNNTSGFTFNGGAGISHLIFPEVFNSAAPVDPDPTNPGGRQYGGPNELFQGVPTKIRGMYTYSVNPVSSWVDQNTWIAPHDAVKPGILTMRDNSRPMTGIYAGDIPYKMRVAVCAEMSMTDTARYSDYVLPVAHWFEVEDWDAFSTHPFMLYQEQAVKPLGDCKSDLEINRLLATALGFGGCFPENEDYIEACLTQSSHATWYKNYCGEDPAFTINAEELRKHKVLRWIPGSNDKPYVFPSQRHTDGSLLFRRTGTGSGRLEVYTDTLRAGLCNNYGQFAQFADMSDYSPNTNVKDERMPTWIEAENVKHDMDINPAYNGEYAYLQEHTKWRVHTQWFNVQWLRELDPEPTIHISQTDALAKNIASGDKVRIYNDNGEAVAKAVITPALRPGVINMPKGWQLDQTIRGSYQALTNRSHHPASVNQSFYDVRVKLEKYNG